MLIRFTPLQWKWLAFGWLFFVTVLLCLPGTALPEADFFGKINLDKWIHLLLYGVLAFTLLQAMPSAQPQKRLVLLCLVILHGVIMEFVQKYLVPFRSFDSMDILSDTLGALLGFVIAGRLKLTK